MSSDDLVGRARPIEALTRTWYQAQAGAPQLVLITGANGIGKTALVRAAIAALRPQHLVFVSGNVEESVVPFGVLDIINNTLLQGLSTGEQPRTDKRHNYIAAGDELLRRISSLDTAGLLIVLDDSHLIDHSTLRSLTYVLRRIKIAKLCVILTTLPTQQYTLPAGLIKHIQDNGTHLSIEGLSAPDVVVLAERLGLASLTGRAARRLQQHTMGNPLHLTLILRELPVQRLNDLSQPLPAPKAFSSLIMGSLAGTSSEARDLAGAVAVLGDHCTIKTAALVANVGDAWTAFQELEGLQLLVIEADPAGWRLVFTHPLIRAAIYEDMRPSLRAKFHSAAAAHLAYPSNLAHRAASCTTGDSELAILLDRHAKILRERGEIQNAIAVQMSAARVSSDEADRTRRLFLALELQVDAGDLASLDAVSQQVNRLPLTGRRLALEAHVAWLRGNLELADHLGGLAWARGDEIEPETLTKLLILMGHIALMRHCGERACEWATRAVTAAKSLAPELTNQARAVAAIGLAFVKGPASGRDWLTADTTWRRSNPDLYADRTPAFGMLQLWSGEYYEAANELAKTSSREVRGEPDAILALTFLADAEYRLGRWDLSSRHASEALMLVEESEQNWLLALAHSISALPAAARGDWANAEYHIGAARKSARFNGDMLGWAYAVAADVHLSHCRLDNESVVRLAAELMTDVLGVARHPGIIPWEASYATALVSLGMMDEASRTISRLEESISSRSNHAAEAAVWRVKGLLAAAQRRKSEARVFLTRAVEMASTGVVDALEVPLGSLSLGRFLRRRGERRAALQYLESAYTEFRSLSAAGTFVEVCETELAALALKSGEVSVSRHGLTPQERAVANLVRLGHSNKDVARQLGLSPKTVSYHLGHVFAKLGVQSRAQLCAATFELEGSPSADVQ